MFLILDDWLMLSTPCPKIIIILKRNPAISDIPSRTNETRNPRKYLFIINILIS